MSIAGWDKVYSETASSSGGAFAKVQPTKQNATNFVFLDVPVPKKIVWVNGASEAYNPKKHSSVRPKTRYMVNVVDADNVGETAQVLEMGPQLFDLVYENLSEHGTDIALKVWKEGSGMDTEYKCLFNRKLKDKEKADLETVELRPLVDSSDEGFGSELDDDGNPF